jgi:hypothetical protein
MRFELREVLHEHADELPGHRVVGLLVSPGFARVEDRRIDTVDMHTGTLKPKFWSVRIGIIQPAFECGIEQCARVTLMGMRWPSP